MAFGMSPFPLQFGSRGGGGAPGDPTALTQYNVDARLTALGLTQTGTGTTWGETGQSATLLYAVAAAKVPLAVETIAGKKYFGPIVNPAGTNLALYSSDATNAAWVKTNCTASLQIGSMSDAAAANGHTLITATANNATALQSITSTSGERVTKWWVSTDDTGVFVSHGAPTGSALYEDDFSSDTSGEWTLGTSVVDGTKGVSGGVLIYTKGASDGVFPRIYRQITGLTAGKRYRINGTISGTSDTKLLRIADNIYGDAQLAELSGVKAVDYFTATATSLYAVLLAGVDAAGVTVTADDISVYEVAETELTPGATPVAVDLAAYTGANPQLGIRIATSGDSVRLYGVQHQVAARALRPRIGPTAGSSVTTGARTMLKTFTVPPSEIDFSMILKMPAASNYPSPFTFFDSGNNIVFDMYYGSNENLTLRKNLSTTVAQIVDELSIVMLDIQWTGSDIRFRVDGGSWNNIAHETIPSSTYAYFGSQSADEQVGQPILAFRDNLQNLLDAAPYGWNTRLLDTWT